MELDEVLDQIGAEGWEGDDATLTCPCGHVIEHDAQACPDGCTNPLRGAGLI